MRGLNGIAKLLAATLCLLPASWSQGQAAAREPSIGYVYPAGGQRGSAIQVTVGGQNLRRVHGAHFSTGGIEASSFIHVPPLNARQRQELQRRLREIRQKRAAAGRNAAQEPEKTRGAEKASDETAQNPVELPDHPLLRNLETLTPYQLRQVADIFLAFRRVQVSRAIQEMVLLDIDIPADAIPGRHELRLITPAGITNPVSFYVGTLPEIMETEPNDPPDSITEIHDLPAVFNGQIMPGDVDRFRFRAQEGQNLLIEVHARQIVPYMADAVPGWFQAVIALYDSGGREVAYADDYLFSPDPVLFYTLPQDGEYTLEIRDAIYRGREDFVYRVYAGENPFITGIFPLGGEKGVPTAVSVKGWNLPVTSMPINTDPGGGFIRKTSLYMDGIYSNPVYYAVDELGESPEQEPNDTITDAQEIMLPHIINGRISMPGDIDVFKFHCPPGYELAVEVHARRLGSPLDSIIRLTDSSGRLLAWNDDSDDKASGLNTHHADSLLYHTVESGGTYFVHLSDVQGHGSQLHAYRLRIGARRADFKLRATPSAVNVPPGGSARIWIHVLPRDGFKGDIELDFRGESHGFRIDGGRIPAGQERIAVTLTAPVRMPDFPVTLQLEGYSVIDGNRVRRPVIPAEEMMQAFGNLHLVACEQLVVSVMRGRPRMQFDMQSEVPVKIPLQDAARVHIRTTAPARMEIDNFTLSLADPPEGISLEETRTEQGTINFTLKTDTDKIPVGFAGNLIVEAFADIASGRPDESGSRRIRKTYIGVMPAIPFEIVDR